MTNTVAMMIAVADENSFIVGAGVGSDMVLLLGRNIACIAK